MAKIDTLIDIDINSLFYQLHTTALKAVEKAKYAGVVDVINFGVDPQSKTFIGAGSFIVVAQHNQKDASLDPKADPETFKDACEDALKVYMTHFAGKDAADSIGPDTLTRLDTPAKAAESSVAQLPLSKLLLEAPEETKKTSGIGYYVEYDVQIEGQKKHKWHDFRDKFEKQLASGVFNALKGIASGAAKTLFGDFFSDMKSFRMKIGGQEYKLGQSVADTLSKVAKGIAGAATVAGQTFKKAFGKTDINELDQNFGKELKSEFTNTTANPTVYKVDTLLTMLRRAKRLDASISSKLMDNGKVFRMEYVITLQVAKTDENYPQYDIPTLHKCFVKALKETKGLSALKEVKWDQFFSQDDIIKVDDFENALGVAKLRRPSAPIESIQAKSAFLKLVLDSSMLDETTATDEMKKQIAALLNDEDDPTKDISQYKMKRVARSIRAMDDSKFDIVLKTAQYSTKDKLANAVEHCSTTADLDAVLSAFAAEGNLEELLDRVKQTLGKSAAANGAKAVATKGDLYIFCLTNVVREANESKKSTSSKKG